MADVGLLYNFTADGATAIPAPAASNTAVNEPTAVEPAVVSTEEATEAAIEAPVDQ